MVWEDQCLNKKLANNKDLGYDCCCARSQEEELIYGVTQLTVLGTPSFTLLAFEDKNTSITLRLIAHDDLI